MVCIPGALASGWRRFARMTNLEAASGLAHEMLADALPRPWMHVQRVADKASEVSSVFWHLLVLVLDWTRQAAPKVSGLSMRQFIP